jgi:arginyl-tRNA synthetase
VRIKSILRKGAEQGDHPAGNLTVNDENRALVLLMMEWPEVVETSLRNYTPHILCDHVYRLANAFSSFYGNCHILSEADSAIRSQRLALCDAVLRQLTLSLGLLGISVPERM